MSLTNREARMEMAWALMSAAEQRTVEHLIVCGKTAQHLPLLSENAKIYLRLYWDE